MIASPAEIQYFLETYRTKHVSNAAIRLGISQPTLTQSLQKLERKLGVDLFVRTKQGVLPTAAGKIFYAKANALADEWESLTAAITKTKSEIAGTFKLGCHTAVGSYVLPPLLKRLSAEAPAIELSLVHDFSRKITERLISFEIDFAYVINPVRHPDLILKKIDDDHIGFWKKKGQQTTPKRLIVDSGLMQTEVLLRRVGSKVFRDWQLLQTSSLEPIRTLTVAGQGVGLLPERIATAGGAEVSRYSEELPTFHDEIFVAYRPQLLSSRAGKELVRLAQIDLG